MKAEDPSILIVGPECAWFDKGVIDGLTNPNGPDDITGKDASGRYYVDVISFHYYAFNGSQTRPQVISKLTSAGGLQDNLVYLNGRISTCNTAHNRTGTSMLKTAITEANIDWQNSASDNLNGNGANSFIGGQFICDMMGVCMKNNVDFINMWSVVEGNSTQLDIGYLDHVSGNKKPTYYHYQMLAENFKGTFATGTTSQPNVKCFGSKDGQQVCVMVLNEDMNSFNYTVRLNNSAISVTNPLLINVNAGIAQEYADNIQGQSSVMLVFNTSGAITRKCVYSLSNATANQAPVCTDYSTTTATSETASSTSSGTFEVKNVYPNPCDGKFNLLVSKGAQQDKEFRVQLFNLLGQEVFNKKYFFEKGKEEIQIPAGIANGEYILRVKEGELDHYLTKKLILQR
jgi:hypothetical protein